LRGSVAPAIRRTRIIPGSTFVFHSLSNSLGQYFGTQMIRNELSELDLEVAAYSFPILK
jgi:hypothetical protein